MAFFELMAGNTAMIIFGFAVVMVFLVLAAQYESWSLPLAVILVVPMCLLSAVDRREPGRHGHQHLHADRFRGAGRAGQQERDPDRRIRQDETRGGEPRRQATLEACRLRLRPIVMTSFAFILGVVPLMLAHGAGAEMRRTLGTAVFSGMLGVTLFGIFLTPVFFFTIDWLGGHARVRLALRARRRTVLTGRVDAQAAPQWATRVRATEASPRHAPRAGLRRTPCCRSEAAFVFQVSSSTDRSSPPCCRSSSRWPAALRCSRCRSRSIRKSRRRRSRSRHRIPAPMRQVVADTVAAPIEQQVNGVENMLYMSSQCTNDGTYIADGHVQERRRSEHGPGAGAEPRGPGPADPARPGQAPRRDRQEEVAQRADDRQPVFARRPAATACT